MPIRLRWEGPFYSHQSLALVNRELAGALARVPGLSVRIRPDEASPALAWDRHRVAELRELEGEDDGPAEVCVRHRWPPELHAPPGERWVMMQPWEYGALPRRWYDPMKFGADEVWVYSGFNRECYVEAGIPAEKVRVVPLGVHPRVLAGAPPFPLRTRKRFRFLFVGGTILRKGIDLLIDAYTRAFGPEDDVALVVKDFGVGTFYRHQTYERFIRELQADPRTPEIEYLGEDLTPEEMCGLYHACDCLVHPYRGEGFGLPVAEAMACGLPVIVTEGGGASDFCTPDTALLVPSARKPVPSTWSSGLDTLGAPWWLEPDVRALRERLREAYEAPEALRPLAERGRSLVRRRHTWEVAAAEAAAGVREVAGAGAAPLAGDPEAQHLLRMADGVRLWERGEAQRALRSFVQAAGWRRSADALFNVGSVLLAGGDARAALPVFAELEGRLHEAEDDPALRAEVGAALAACRATLDDPPPAEDGPVRVRWYAPLFNASGYASESRAFLAGVLDGTGWRVELAPQDPVREEGIMDPRLFARLRALVGGAADPPEVDFQHGPAHAFTLPRGRVSVCRTMLETDRIPEEWAEACNRFTEVWVPTAFNRETFARSGVLPEKIRVVPGAIEAELYDPARYPRRPIAGAKGFRFLSVFDFTPRKGWDLLLRAYFEEFSPAEEVSLVVKVVSFFGGEATPHERVREFVAREGLGEIPNLVLIDRHCSDDELRGLYGSADAFVLPSRGEGWGRPYMEAMAFGLPTIGTRWSGNLEFMNDDNSFLIEVDGLEACERTWSGMRLYEGHRWAVPSVASLRRLMRRVYEDREEAARRGARARADVLAGYDLPVVGRRFRAEMQRLLGTTIEGRSTCTVR